MRYIKPEVEIVQLESEDVITASNVSDQGNYGEENDTPFVPQTW